MPLTYMGGKIATLDDASLSGRKVLVRVDLNSPIGPAGIIDDSRIIEAAGSIRELADSGASVVIMSHQGRPLENDFVSLEEHSRLLEKYSGVRVDFVMDVIGPEALRRIREVKPGDALLLDNTRLVSEDYIEAPGKKHAEGVMVSRLAPLVDYYVNDAFSACHRSHASIVGFPYRIPGLGGRILEREVRALNKAVSEDERPKVVVLGGAKLKDAVKIVDFLTAKGVVDEILTTGLVGLLFLYAKGYKMSRKVEDLVRSKAGEEALRKARRIVEEGRRVRTPLDFVVERDGSLYVSPAEDIEVGIPKDVGPSTVEYYRSKLKGARVAVLRGPAGVIEDPRFRRGTVELAKAALELSHYVIFGGGHFRVILGELPIELRERVGHISTGGGALLYFLSGRSLPGLEALVDSARIFNLV